MSGEISESILKLINEKLPEGRTLRPGQSEAIAAYVAEMSRHHNIAVHLPTGYGKTLVGLAVAEFRRTTLKAKPVWLCPTRQLVYQVVERAKEVNIPAFAFVGTKGGPDPNQRLNYNLWQIGKAIAVTVYERVFTRTPPGESPDAAGAMTFDLATFAVLDDVHAAEQAVAAYWTLSLPRHLQFSDRRTQKEVGEPFHNPVYFELLRVIYGHLPEKVRKEYDFLRSDVYTGTEKLPYDGAPIYCLPFPVLADRVEVIRNAITELLRWKNLRGLTQDFPGISKDYYDPLYFQRQVWDNIKDQLYFFQMFVGRGSIVMRPYLCPVGEHPVWTNIKDRLFMSATMRVDGEIQRLFGVEDIHHIQQSVDVVAGTGRRLLLGVDRAATGEGGRTELDAVLEPVDRFICLTQNESEWNDLTRRAPSVSRKRVFEAGETERHRDEFLAEPASVLKYFGRYEGLDIPNDKCRVVLLYGLPAGLSPMEKFLTYEIGCQDLIEARVAGRVEQGVGRCNRQPGDLSLVLMDQDTYTWVLNKQDLFSPFMLNECAFSLGLRAASDAADLVRRFMNDDNFRATVVTQHDANIAGDLRTVSVGVSAPAEGAWRDEIRFARSFWTRRRAEATSAAMRAADAYRARAVKESGAEGDWRKAAWWFYLAGIAKALEEKKPGQPFDYAPAVALWADGITCMEEGGGEADKLEWWRGLIDASTRGGGAAVGEATAIVVPDMDTLDGACLARQVTLLEGLMRSRSFSPKLLELRSRLGMPAQGGVADAKQFEKGIEQLGQWMGFETKGAQPRGADAVWWAKPRGPIRGYTWIIFEAKSSEQGGPEEPINRESLDQLNMWREIEKASSGLSGEEELFLVRVGNRRQLVTPATSEPERTALATLAGGKTILLVRDLQEFYERLEDAFQETFALSMKKPSLQGDVQALKQCLYYFLKGTGALPSEFIRLLTANTYRRAVG